MATYTTVQGHEFVAPITSDSGNLFCVFTKYTLPSIQAGDVIELVRVPRGAKFVSLKVGTDGDTGGGTLNVGLSEDADFFATAIAMDGNEHELILGYKECESCDDTVITATVTATGTAASGKNLYVKVFYTLTNIGE